MISGVVKLCWLDKNHFYITEFITRLTSPFIIFFKSAILKQIIFVLVGNMKSTEHVWELLGKCHSFQTYFPVLRYFMVNQCSDVPPILLSYPPSAIHYAKPLSWPRCDCSSGLISWCVFNRQRVICMKICWNEFQTNCLQNHSIHPSVDRSIHSSSVSPAIVFRLFQLKTCLLSFI